MITLPPDLKFPVLVRPKLRGVRCFIVNGEPLLKEKSEKARPVPNRFMADILNGLPNFDGMIIVGDVLQPVCTAATYEAVMSSDQAPLFSYQVCDLVTTGKYSFEERYGMARDFVRACRGNIALVVHARIADVAKLAKFERDQMLSGYPGIVVRDPEATVGGIWSTQ